MKKMLLRLCLLAVVPLAFFGACTKTEGGNGNVTLTGYMQIDPADPQYADWNPTLEAFAAEYPNIKLQFEYVTGEQYHDKFQIMAASGQIPDLFTLYAGPRSNYLINRGAVKDLRKFLTEDFMANYNSAIWEPQGSNGEIYIISPNMAVATIIYANPAILNQLNLTPARTMDELNAQVSAIRDAGFDVVSFGNNAVWTGSTTLQSLLLNRTAGKEWFDQAMVGQAKFSDKPFVDSLQVIKQMMDSRIFPAGVNQLTGMNSITDFVNGKSAYLLQTGWALGSIKGAASPEFFNQIIVLPFPDLPGDVSPGSNVATLGEALAMNSKLSGEKEDAAWKFLSFIYGPKGMDLLLRSGTAVTYKLDLTQYDLDPVQRQYIELINSQQMGYIVDAKMDGEGVNSVLNTGIQAVMMGDKSPQQVADEYEAWVAANDSNRPR